jgi:chromosome segregation ATPase
LIQFECKDVSYSPAKRAKKDSYVLGQIKEREGELACLDWRIKDKNRMAGGLKVEIKKEEAEIKEKEDKVKEMKADIKSFEVKVRKMDREKKDAETEILRLKGLIGV